MKTPQHIQDLVAEMVHLHSSAQLELDPLPSGVCFLWVTIGRRNFVLEHDPKAGTGVSENFPGTPPFVGHDEAFTSLEDAVSRFKSLLREAERTEADYSPAAFVLNEKSTN